MLTYLIGASLDNINTVSEFVSEAAGLKMYLNETFTTLRLNSLDVWSKHIANWPKRAPLCVHAEGQTTAAIILLASLQNHPVHICHVARKEEILLIRAAKEKGLKVTCEVCPHHLFLSTNDIERIGASKSQVRKVYLHLTFKEKIKNFGFLLIDIQHLTVFYEKNRKSHYIFITFSYYITRTEH